LVVEIGSTWLSGVLWDSRRQFPISCNARASLLTWHSLRYGTAGSRNNETTHSPTKTLNIVLPKSLVFLRKIRSSGALCTRYRDATEKYFDPKSSPLLLSVSVAVTTVSRCQWGSGIWSHFTSSGRSPTHTDAHGAATALQPNVHVAVAA